MSKKKKTYNGTQLTKQGMCCGFAFLAPVPSVLAQVHGKRVSAWPHLALVTLSFSGPLLHHLYPYFACAQGSTSPNVLHPVENHASKQAPEKVKKFSPRVSQLTCYFVIATRIVQYIPLSGKASFQTSTGI